MLLGDVRHRNLQQRMRLSTAHPELVQLWSLADAFPVCSISGSPPSCRYPSKTILNMITSRHKRRRCVLPPTSASPGERNAAVLVTSGHGEAG